MQYVRCRKFVFYKLNRAQQMKTLLKLEEYGQFFIAIALFTNTHWDWWVFPACILLPDIAMVGYFVNPAVGAWVYNVFHHRLTAALLITVGQYFHQDILLLTGIVILGHAALDRIFGYGLKWNDHFKHTHLGWIGADKAKNQNS